MGSLVLAYPMMDYLRKRYPGVQLKAVVFEKNREALDLLNIVGKNNILVIRDSSAMAFFNDLVGVVRKIRGTNIDIVIDCELFARVSSLLAFLSGAPIKVGFYPFKQEGLYRGNFINRRVLYNPYLHISRQFLNLAYALEDHTIPGSKHVIPTEPLVVPQVNFPIEEIESYAVGFRRDWPSLGDRRLVLIYPSGGALPIRAWPLEYYCRLCESLIEEGLSIGIIGPQSDKLLGQEIVEFTGSEYCINLTGYTHTLRELLLLFEQSELLVTNDGGPAQFSSIGTIPSIIFFGPESPQIYGPLSSNSYCFYSQLSCSPCLTAYNHRNSPCDGDNQCLKRITVEEVLDKTREILIAPQFQSIGK
jgi:ADP-heptose:LPS heptosyltransferase